MRSGACISCRPDYDCGPGFPGLPQFPARALRLTRRELMKPSFLSSMLRILMAALFVMTFAALLSAQSTTDGAIGGTIFDGNGAVIPKAQVLVRNNGTNAEQTVTTDDSGSYRVIKLQPGSYTVSVNHPGFSAYKAEQVIVGVGAVTEVSPHLQVGTATQVVDVTAEA